MNFFQYVKDRFILILAWLISLALCLLVIYLDLSTGREFIRGASITYCFILGASVLTAGLVFDFLYQRAWFRELKTAEQSEDREEVELNLYLQHPVTQEQKVVHELLTRQYHAYMNELLMMRKQREQHVHFTNQWVHHMKTPVSVLHLITQQPPAAMTVNETEQLLQSVQEETERLTRGLELMLSTARLDKFEMDLNVSQLSLTQCVRNVLNQHKKLLIRHHIFPKIVGEDAMVESDSKWLAFILTQLVTNAIKYSRDKEGSKSLLFTIERKDHAVRLHVKDEGIGIAEQDLSRIFDPFFTGENGRREGDATGMGLYLVKQVCGRLGHTIQASSVLHEGTVFTITFAGDSLHKGVIV